MAKHPISGILLHHSNIQRFQFSYVEVDNILSPIYGEI